MNVVIMNIISAIFCMFLAALCSGIDAPGHNIVSGIFMAVALLGIVNVIVKAINLTKYEELIEELNKEKPRYEEAIRIMNIYYKIGIYDCNQISDEEEKNDLQNIIDFIKTYKQKQKKAEEYKRR